MLEFYGRVVYLGYQSIVGCSTLDVQNERRKMSMFSSPTRPSRSSPRGAVPAILTPYPSKKSYKRNRNLVCGSNNSTNADTADTRANTRNSIRVAHAVTVDDPNISPPTFQRPRDPQSIRRNKCSSNDTKKNSENKDSSNKNTPRQHIRLHRQNLPHHYQQPQHLHQQRSQTRSPYPSYLERPTIMSKNNRKTTTPTSSNKTKKKTSNIYSGGCATVDDDLMKRMKNMKIVPLRHDGSGSNFMTAKEIILKNLRIWAGQVYDVVGHGQKEKVYQSVLRNVLLNQGFDVGVEVPFCFLRRDPRTGVVEKITRRADLIVSLAGHLDKVLIECKAKPKILKEDMEQVISYREHFGVDECYLVNFRPGLDVLRLREESVHVHPRGIPPAATLGESLTSPPQQQQKFTIPHKSSTQQPSAPVGYSKKEQIKSKRKLRSDLTNMKKNPALVVDTTTPQSDTTRCSSQLNRFSPAVTGLSSSSSSTRNAKTPSTIGQTNKMNTKSQIGKSMNFKHSTTPIAATPHAAADDRSSSRRNQNVHYRRQSLPTPTNNLTTSRVTPPVIPSAPPEEDVFSHHNKNRRKPNLLPMDRLRVLHNWKTTNHHS